MGNVLLVVEIGRVLVPKPSRQGVANLVTKVSQRRLRPPVRKWAAYRDWMEDNRDICLLLSGTM